MRKVYLKSDFAIKIPENWVSIGEQEVISVYDPKNGKGALQFSFYTVEDAISLNLVDELQDFLKGKNFSTTPSLKNDTAYLATTAENNKYWRYWLIRRDETIIFVTYNCSNEDIGSDDNFVEEIISSISKKSV